MIVINSISKRLYYLNEPEVVLSKEVVLSAKGTLPVVHHTPRFEHMKALSPYTWFITLPASNMNALSPYPWFITLPASNMNALSP
jgi:hypothetical protein